MVRREIHFRFLESPMTSCRSIGYSPSAGTCRSKRGASTLDPTRVEIFGPLELQNHCEHPQRNQ
jgi:hypothetical protein